MQPHLEIQIPSGQTRRNVMVRLAAAICIGLGTVNGAFADTHVMTAPDAFALVQRGDLVMLDIRSREEWLETGVAVGALPVSMHEPDFGRRLMEILQQYPPEKIALICATGGRSEFVVNRLAAQGITGLRDVPEGMMGHGDAPGWIARGLPITAPQNAEAEYEAMRDSWAEK